MFRGVLYFLPALGYVLINILWLYVSFNGYGIIKIMNSESLFSLALNLQFPWEIKEIKFDHAESK
ncbi:hypothetical protein SAMN05428978_100828 [Nitrosomonas sp. Nm34]|nr:hypothetical protein SAMN05428978_100828 [Nitrosomonas sp. Nm34]